MPGLLWLSRHDVDAAGVGPAECVELVRKTMEWHGQCLLEVPTKLGIHPPHGRHINAMPAFVQPLPAAGLKWVADFPENRRFGLPTINALIVLNDPVGRELQAAARFCQELGPKVGVELIPFAEREHAVRGADLVVTVTNSTSTRLLEPDWVSPGATVVVLDNAGKETTLLHSMDRVIVDDRRPFATEDVRRRFPSGVPQIDGEIGEVLISRIQGRRNAQERILILNLGFAACDVVVAAEIYKRATENRLGITLEL
jgi:ornithine cyclodeaminase/alanine dehydrogenase-like protein (mu-crystallin family)